MSTKNFKIITGDALKSLEVLQDESVQCCVTSPPYWGLRDYGNARQLGMEKTPEEYVKKMVEVFREVRRVLKNDGTLWLNLGDTYSSGGRKTQTRDTFRDAASGKQDYLNGTAVRAATPDNCKPKDLVGIPWMVAFALRADGWYLRQDIIWSKPNPMPESVTDRCTKAHEYLFLLTKSARYYYDSEAIKEMCADVSLDRLGRGVSDDHKLLNGSPGQSPHSCHQPRKNVKFGGNNRCPDTRLQSGKEWKPKMAGGGSSYKNGHSGYFDSEGNRIGGLLANKRSVWTVTTQPFKDAHFATYPPDLIKPCILAGSKAGDTILDPFGGSGTTGMVALELGRNALLIELNPDYVKLIEQRCDVTPGLAL